MNSFVLTSVVTLLLIAFTSALPNTFSSASMKMSDTTQPQNTMMGQSLKDLGIEVCPDKLHLCPGTAECCQKEDGKWGCCPKTVATIGECCNQLGFVYTCCTDLVPKCHWWGCWWS
ncbi:hypothetical protein AVEN_234572-1 [Araneus ventricosus]|uniref:Granulins domain-containing protein n=1 Tax=Araneus ventricosus TaxID=182803 RepID=A0A4Y2A9F2_ARAVE|nr:hypothetical protein AVEN_234572-1 [Araneus ventricosus]